MIFRLHEPPKSDDKDARYIVIDIDGTLANVDHRVHLAEAKEWTAFNAACSEDTVNSDVCEFIDIVSHSLCDVNVLLLTGRSDAYRQQTLDWLQKHALDGFITHLLMRDENDRRPDWEIKPELLFRFFETPETAHNRVIFIVEDRDRVVEAWRNLGFKCWQPRAGGY